MIDHHDGRQKPAVSLKEAAAAAARGDDSSIRVATSIKCVPHRLAS
jgi:hypothetical protein